MESRLRKRFPPPAGWEFDNKRLCAMELRLRPETARISRTATRAHYKQDLYTIPIADGRWYSVTLDTVMSYIGWSYVIQEMRDMSFFYMAKAGWAYSRCRMRLFWIFYSSMSFSLSPAA